MEDGRPFFLGRASASIHHLVRNFVLENHHPVIISIIASKNGKKKAPQDPG